MGAHILVIEDNKANLELARYLLDSSGHAVTTATDGSAGLSLALQLRPDLIISDLQMPVLDVVVALTASSMVNDRAHVLDAGFNGYFSKPIEPQTFVAQIVAFLPDRLRTCGPVAAG